MRNKNKKFKISTANEKSKRYEKQLPISIPPSKQEINGVRNKSFKLSPINILGQKAKDTVTAIKNRLRSDKFNIKKHSEHLHTIRLETYNEFVGAKKVLSEIDTQFYTYTPKEEKHQTLLLKGIDNAYEPQEVLELLKEKKISNVSFTKVTRFTTPNSIKNQWILPIYIVEMSPDSKRNGVHAIKNLDHHIITWEALRKSEIVQSKNCQRFNHTAAN